MLRIDTLLLKCFEIINHSALRLQVLVFGSCNLIAFQVLLMIHETRQCLICALDFLHHSMMRLRHIPMCHCIGYITQCAA